MSSIWIEQPDRRWLTRPLVAERPLDDLIDGARLLAARRGALLLTRDGVRARVNGEPVLGGLRVLAHGDEILVGTQRIVFSARTTPRVSTYHASDGRRAPTCALCRGVVKDGASAVECPGCGRWMHQGGGRDCWTYAETCRFCNHPTALDAADAWHPEPEEARA